MTEEIKKVWKIWSGQIIAFAIIIALMIWLTACRPTVASLNGSPEYLTRDELTAEVEHFLARAEIRFADLQRQEEFRKLLSQNAVVVAQGGTINPLGLITTLAAIFGMGAAIDDVKLRKKLKEYHVP